MHILLTKCVYLYSYSHPPHNTQVSKSYSVTGGFFNTYPSRLYYARVASVHLFGLRERKKI